MTIRQSNGDIELATDYCFSLDTANFELSFLLSPYTKEANKEIISFKLNTNIKQIIIFIQDFKLIPAMNELHLWFKV